MINTICAALPHFYSTSLELTLRFGVTRETQVNLHWAQLSSTPDGLVLTTKRCMCASIAWGEKEKEKCQRSSRETDTERQRRPEHVLKGYCEFSD